MSHQSPDYAKAALYMSFMCNEASLTMTKSPQDRAIGVLLLGSLFLCGHIHTCELYFKEKDNENWKEN